MNPAYSPVPADALDPETRRPGSPAGEADPSVVADWPAALGELLDISIAHIHRAGLIIGKRSKGAGPASDEELDQVTDELEGAIRPLRLAAHEGRLARVGGISTSGNGEE